MDGQVAEAYGWSIQMGISDGKEWEFWMERNGSFGWKDAFPSIEFLVIFVQVPGSHFLFGGVVPNTEGTSKGLVSSHPRRFG